MTSESGNTELRRWIVEPAGAEQIKLQIASGDAFEVTPEVQSAFAALIEKLNGGDVQAYASSAECPDHKWTCLPNGKCSWEAVQPCYVDYLCLIERLG
jgi:hypothetical protein